MKDLSIKSPLPMLVDWSRKLRPYVGVLLFLFFAFIYGYMILQISTYSNPHIDEADVLSEVKSSPTPRIDEEAVKKLQSLKDNSVNVQTLFEEDRTNPFQE